MRNYTVKVKGFAPFTMLLMEHDGGTPWQICYSVFVDKLESIE